MATRVLLPQIDHGEALADLLTCNISRLQMFYLHVYDIQVYGEFRLSMLLKSLLAERRTVLIVLGEDPTTIDEPRVRQKALDFFKDLMERGALVYVLDHRLHAKLVRCEQSDGSKIIISSANLSHKAYHENLEIGVLISEDLEADNKVKQFIHHVMSHRPSPLEGVLEDYERNY
jgi:phosphatidylserine/phosphatidylglycerophosphate/cardiolipin synthase-like enzyme